LNNVEFARFCISSSEDHPKKVNTYFDYGTTVVNSQAFREYNVCSNFLQKRDLARFCEV